MKIKYLTFDCYGTLIDWKAGIEENFRSFNNNRQLNTGIDIFHSYVELEAKKEKAYKPYKAILKDTSLELAKSMGLGPSDSAAEKFANSITHWPAFTDTAPTLKELGKAGYRRVILSNIDRDLLQETIRNNNLEVDGFITAQDISSYKPGEKHWIEFLKSYKAKKEEVLHVANSIYHDIIPAARLGLKTVWVNRYGESLPDDINSSYVVNRLSDLLNLLR
jgi:2-haloalkanoic acid dehalogenase type II